MKVTKKVAIILILSLILSTITACGKASAKNDGVRISSDNTVSEIGDSDNNEDSDNADNSSSTKNDSQDENNMPTNGGDSVRSSSNQQTKPSKAPDEYVSDEDFWNGEKKFDLGAYFMANGFNFWGISTDSNGRANTTVTLGSTQSAQGEWTISVLSTGMDTFSFTENGEGGTVSYAPAKDWIKLDNDVAVDDTDKAFTSKECLECTFMIVKAIVEHTSDDDPLSYYPDYFHYIGDNFYITYSEGTN